MKNIYLLCILFSIGCSASTTRNPADADPSSYLIAKVKSASGVVTLTNPESKLPITTVGVQNTGTGTITITHFHVITTAGDSIDLTSGDSGFGVLPGSGISTIFANGKPVDVSKIEFTVQGSTEGIEVYGINHSGPVPTGFSTGN